MTTGTIESARVHALTMPDGSHLRVGETQFQHITGRLWSPRHDEDHSAHAGRLMSPLLCH